MSKYIEVFENALSSKLCDTLIRQFENDSRVKADPQPDYSTRKYIYASGKKDWIQIINRVSNIEKRLTFQFFKKLGAMIDDWSDDGYVLAKYKKGDTCILHNDNQSVQARYNGLRYATLIFYLNSVERGGETFFPQQSVKVKPQQGTAIMFPAMLTHPHQVLSPATDRYILQTWITDPYMEVNLKHDEGPKGHV